MGGFMNYVATHRKAIIGGLLAAVSAYSASAATGATWQASAIAAVIAALGGGVVVGAVPNKKAP